MRSEPHVEISPGAVPRVGLRRHMMDALAEVLRDAPGGPWFLEIDPAPLAASSWTLHMEGLRRCLIQTVPPAHQDLPDLLRLVAGILSPLRLD